MIACTDAVGTMLRYRPLLHGKGTQQDAERSRSTLHCPCRSDSYVLSPGPLFLESGRASYDVFCRSSDSPTSRFAFPSAPQGMAVAMVMNRTSWYGLTAAGLFRTCTGFPFNLGFATEARRTKRRKYTDILARAYAGLPFFLRRRHTEGSRVKQQSLFCGCRQNDSVSSE